MSNLFAECLISSGEWRIRLLIVENNRQSPISFAPDENRAQELICFAQCRTSVRFVSWIWQTPMLTIGVFFSMTNCRICCRIVIALWLKANEKRCNQLVYLQSWPAVPDRIIGDTAAAYIIKEMKNICTVYNYLHRIPRITHSAYEIALSYDKAISSTYLSNNVK